MMPLLVVKRCTNACVRNAVLPKLMLLSGAVLC
ncbi:hypothetical protein Slip_1596 [Syntrophothermus lipocalidus DSM 12680]|uniref:Uncharacterized protein n=1 Tax=Syntrophothermus lipocalidus (strain DSM 12680 / TGB-C1) TaxID=643648 RepID=D7CNS3_SYNLT|nr:hypothetical protein Slip_1596 [Syntrophothermus lipocalidus DSM 12680]